MRLNLRDIVNTPGASISFDYPLDLSDLDFYGARPAVHPVRVEGTVRNRAGALTLEGNASTLLELVCDRCGKPFSQEQTLSLDTLLAARLEDEESEGDIYLLDGEELDLDELARTVFILGMEPKHLCSEDCKGLCARCGADLDEGPCGCKREPDPRLAGLAKLLEQPEE